MTGRPGLMQLLFVALLTLAGSPAVARPDSAVLLARPGKVASQLPPGVTAIGANAIAYVPVGATGRLPLVLLLHGAGEKAATFVDGFKPLADRYGFIILAPQSSHETWDFAERRHFGADVDRIDSALRELFSRTAVDPKHIVAAGFSDGGSYALSLGLANRRLFRGIIALSPGFLTEKAPFEPERVFVAHGSRDHVLPYTYAIEELVPRLQAGGARVRFQTFSGGHEIDPVMVEEGLKFTLGIKPPAARGGR